MRTRPGPITYNPPGAPGPSASAAVDPGITSLVDLAAISTVGLITPYIKIWIQASDGTTQVWQLLASQAATVAGVIQRPNDFNALTNARAWFHAG